MERWEYAFGTEDYRAYPGPAYNADSEPGTYAEAERALMRALAADNPTSDYSLNGPCIVRRSDRHPTWVPVVDHAAELLAEVLTDMALRFAANGDDIMQAKDLNRIIKHVAFSLKPASTEEYGE